MTYVDRKIVDHISKNSIDNCRYTIARTARRRLNKLYYYLNKITNANGTI